MPESQKWSENNVCVREWEVNYQVYLFRITSQCSLLSHDIRPRLAFQQGKHTTRVWIGKVVLAGKQYIESRRTRDKVEATNESCRFTVI
jgi:hypothetical protein